MYFACRGNIIVYRLSCITELYNRAGDTWFDGIFFVLLYVE